MIWGASLSGNAKTKIVARMKKLPLYYAVNRSEPELAGELNDALQKIIDNNPEFYAQMSEKYKINGANAAATFTREEEEYIQEGKTIYLVVNEELPPISWLDDKTGEYRGISIDIAREIENYSGLHIEPINGEELDELVSENPDIMGDVLALSPDDITWAKQRNIMMTNHVVDSSIVMISRTGKAADPSDSETKVALPKNYYASVQIAKTLDKEQIIYYDSIQECLEAVNRGKADATYMNSLVARYYMSMLRYANLYISEETGHAENLSYGVYLDSDTPLLSILDKSLLCIGSERTNQIVVNYAHADETFSLEGMYYSNPALSIGVVLVFCALLGLTVYFILRVVNAERRGKQEKTLARFMGYVCAANEDVMEVNLDKLTAQSYSLTDSGEVTVRSFPYYQVHGQNYEELIHPEDYTKLAEGLTEGALDEMFDMGGGERYFECRAKGGDGKYYWYSYSLQTIPKDKDHPRNFILFKRNIDNAKREEEESRQALVDALENAREASEAKGNFLSRISHEIRTPLNAIIGYISIARQPDSDVNKIGHCLESCEMASRHLLSILNDVLDMSSIESGKLKIAKEAFDLKEVLNELLAIYSEQARKKKIQFVLTVHDLDQEWVIGDRMRVNQILYNLISNAIKFTGENGKVSLNITQMESTNAKCRIKFEVSDTGIGMSEEYMTRLFKPFEQESSKTAQKFGGTGLGLSIAWNLITMMGGSIDARSKQGEGTTFTVLLTFEHSTINEEKKVTSIAFSKIRTLLVVENEEDSTYLKALLKGFGMKFDVVASGTKAVQRIKSRKQTDYSYKLCIMDWELAENNVLDVLKRITSEADIPVILMTEHDDSALQDEAAKAGAAKVISKPVFQSTLFDLLVEVFGNSTVENQEEIEQIDFTGARILLAEDNEMNREIAGEILKRSGLQIDTAVDGKDALEKFTSSEPGTYQAILMDIQMPIMDGYEATRQIRASAHPEAQTIPIIATTANAFSEDVAAALACGMNGHIAKPIDYKKLYAVLERVMK